MNNKFMNNKLSEWKIIIYMIIQVETFVLKNQFGLENGANNLFKTAIREVWTKE